MPYLVNGVGHYVDFMFSHEQSKTNYTSAVRKHKVVNRTYSV